MTSYRQRSTTTSRRTSVTKKASTNSNFRISEAILRDLYKNGNKTVRNRLANRYPSLFPTAASAPKKASVKRAAAKKAVPKREVSYRIGERVTVRAYGLTYNMQITELSCTKDSKIITLTDTSTGKRWRNSISIPKGNKVTAQKMETLVGRSTRVSKTR